MAWRANCMARSQLAAARGRHRALKLSDGESVGPVELYVLRTGLPRCRVGACRRRAS